MEKTIEKIENVLKRIIVLFGDIALIILLSCCVLQVFTRYVLNDSLTWTEELARFSFMYVSFLGAALCVNAGTHARITVLVDFVPRPVQLVFEYIGYVIILICAYVMVTQGFGLLATVGVQKSPMLKIPMSVFYAACPIGAVFMAIYSFLKILHGIAHLFASKKESEE